MTPESTPPASQGTPAPTPGKAGLKLLLELGPLILFFWMNSHYRVEGTNEGILIATKGFLLAIAVAFPIAWRMEGKLPVMPLVTAIMVGGFGGLTIWLEDELFIQLKPTVASLFFAALLLGGLARGKFFLRTLFSASMRLDDEGWRKLTIRWSSFFLLLAACNEVVRNFFTVDEWVTFKVWGILPMTFVFTMSQIRLMHRHELKDEETTPAETEE
jgi:intracellular septation protein